MTEPTTTIAFDLGMILRLSCWGALGMGTLLILVGMNGNYSLQIAGCFLGIISRIIQAEGHFELKRRQL